METRTTPNRSIGVRLLSGVPMSLWYEPKKEDIDFSDDGKDMHIWLCSDDCGNVYASVDVCLLKELIKENDKRNKKR